MLDFSFAEIALIVIVAVILIGPKDLPVVIRAVSKAMRAMRSLAGDIRKAFEEIGEESGLKDTAEEFRHEITMIRGDDGKMYEAYVPPPAGGRLGGGQSFTPEQASPHPNPPPNGEGAND